MLCRSPVLLVDRRVPFDLRHRRVLLYDYFASGCKRLEEALRTAYTRVLLVDQRGARTALFPGDRSSCARNRGTLAAERLCRSDRAAGDAYIRAVGPPWSTDRSDDKKF